MRLPLMSSAARWWRRSPRPRRVAASAALLATVCGVAVLGVSGPSGARAVAAAVMDPMAVLAGRSPGVRGPGVLHQVKPAFPPSERVRAPVPVGPGTTAPPGVASVPPYATVVPSDPAFEAVDGGLPDVGAPFLPAVVPGGGFGVVPVGGGGVFVPGIPGGGGGVVAPPTTEPIPPPVVDPVTPVPEPATWISMILGFGAIGASMRRRRAGTPASAR